MTDLYQFPHAYAQNYAFIYCLDSDRSARDQARIDRALEEYPWRGGYSYVNIYTVLQNQVPLRDRPRIKSINKSSPGWLDLLLNIDVAISVAKSVATLAGSGVAATYAYKQINKYLGDIKVDRKRHRLQELQITQAQAKVLTSMSTEMAKFLGFKNLKELHERTGNPEVTLKMLQAHFRRITTLVEYEEAGKARLTY
ncbi:MAG TPA: hypothetical protein VGG11_03670 [Xanthobacteraceae bacterium]